jgi:hypothetical protein
VEKDVKSVVYDHSLLCPLLAALEGRLGLPHMLYFEYTTIFCEMFVHGSDDGDGNHVEPISWQECARLCANAGSMTTQTIDREWNNGRLVAGATQYGWTGHKSGSGFSDLTPSILHGSYF